MDPRVESMAKILVEYSTKVRKGDIVRQVPLRAVMTPE